MSFLKETFLKLNFKLKELDQNALRDQKIDFTVMTPDQLEQQLQITEKKYQKKKLLQTEVGYLRINLFQEYYERIQVAQENKELDKAVQLMKVYLETVAMPFIEERLHPSVLSRLTKLFSTNTTPDAAEILQEWKDQYETWNKQKEASTNDEKNLNEQFDQLKRTFITLYTISFSFENFPPVAPGMPN